MAIDVLIKYDTEKGEERAKALKHVLQMGEPCTCEIFNGKFDKFLGVVKKEKPRVIVIDWGYTRGGKPLVEAIREICPDVPIIGFSEHENFRNLFAGVRVHDFFTFEKGEIFNAATRIRSIIRIRGSVEIANEFCKLVYQKVPHCEGGRTKLLEDITTELKLRDLDHTRAYLKTIAASIGRAREPSPWHTAEDENLYDLIRDDAKFKQLAERALDRLRSVNSYSICNLIIKYWKTTDTKGELKQHIADEIGLTVSGVKGHIQTIDAAYRGKKENARTPHTTGKLNLYDTLDRDQEFKKLAKKAMDLYFG